MLRSSPLRAHDFNVRFPSPENLLSHLNETNDYLELLAREYLVLGHKHVSSGFFDMPTTFRKTLINVILDDKRRIDEEKQKQNNANANKANP